MTPSAPLVLITGCNGLVGSHVARQLRERGCRVRGLRRVGTVPNPDADPTIEWVTGDLLDIPSLEQALAGADWVVHAAAQTSAAPGQRSDLLRTNVEGTANLVNCALRASVQRFCHVSSIAALGLPVPATSIPLDETATWTDSAGQSYYAKTKYLAELEVWRGVAEGLPAVIVNPSAVLGGVGNWHQSGPRLFGHAWLARPGYLPGNLNYVDARDVAQIIFLLLRSDITAKRFILNAGNESYKNLLFAMADWFQKHRPWLALQPWVLRGLWPLAWLTGLVTRRPAYPARAAADRADTPLQYSSQLVMNTLNFKFRPLSETIAWGCQAYQRRYGS